VLLDVMMPRENGYRISRMLREDEARGGGRRYRRSSRSR
jgi:CheY-like chemotaxis protein